MANITSLLPVLGSHQQTLQPFEWHVWEINLAVAAFAGAGPDDATLVDILPKDTRILAVKTQVLTPVTVATSLVLDVEIAKRTAAGVVTPISNLLASVACQTSSTVEAASGSTTFDDIFIDSDIQAGTQSACINLEFTKTGAVSGVPGRMLLAILMGRVRA